MDKLTEIIERACTKCGETKPIEKFSKAKKGLYGRRSTCKECDKKYLSEYRQTEKGKVLYKKCDAKYFRSEKGLANKKRYTEKNELQVKARAILNNAVRDGRLKKQTCAICKDENSEAHHKDYTKPLEVVWLCKTHHRQIEKMMGRPEAYLFNTIAEQEGK